MNLEQETKSYLFNELEKSKDDIDFFNRRPGFVLFLVREVFAQQNDWWDWLIENHPEIKSIFVSLIRKETGCLKSKH